MQEVKKQRLNVEFKYRLQITSSIKTDSIYAFKH